MSGSLDVATSRFSIPACRDLQSRQAPSPRKTILEDVWRGMGANESVARMKSTK
jgi:hypothetical protein